MAIPPAEFMISVVALGRATGIKMGAATIMSRFAAGNAFEVAIVTLPVPSAATMSLART